jgi:hypothetical protein
MSAGDNVYNNLKPIIDYCNNVNHGELDNLSDLGYSNATFGLNFPFFIDVNDIDENNPKRQSKRFKSEQYLVMGKKVRVTSQWNYDDIPYFEKYLEAIKPISNINTTVGPKNDIFYHPLLGNKIDYNVLNPKQQEAYNLQKASAIFAQYGYLVIKLSDDWNGADFIALKFGTDDYLKVQLKGRLGFFKKYLGKNITICFFDSQTQNCYLYPHDELCEIIMKKHKNTDSWLTKGEYHFPTINDEHREILKKYVLIELSE